MAVGYFVGSGFLIREDVFLADYIVPPEKNEMTIAVGVESSAGYIRTVKNVSEDPAVIQLKFYSAFGGVNGSMGEKHRFVIEVSAECREICFFHHGKFERMLFLDETTGEWKRAE